MENIFELAVHGAGAAKITRLLHDERIPSPGWLNYQRYGTFAHICAEQVEEKAYDWTIAQVNKQRKDEVYIRHSIHNWQSNQQE